MTKVTEKAVNTIKSAVGEVGKTLRGLDYYEFVDELAGHLAVLRTGYKEEHPEDFA